MRKAFGETIVEMAVADYRLVLLTGDVEQEMAEFKKRFPKRFFNLGLTEQSMISMAAGMALEGLIPVVYSITPFVLERPFEQIKIDIDQQCLPVILVGYSYYPTHGPTHRPLNENKLCGCFHNILPFFPTTAHMASYHLRWAHERANGGAHLPSFISLTKDGIR